jgi:hypothetical protein
MICCCWTAASVRTVSREPGDRPEQSAMEAYACTYVAYTLYGWIEVWFQRGMKESPDEMAAMFPGESTS